MRALAALGRHDPLPSLPVVLGALDDDSREVRLAAVLVVEARPGSTPALRSGQARDAAAARATGRRRPFDPAVGAPGARRAPRSPGHPGAGPDRLGADDRAPHGGRRRARLTCHGRGRGAHDAGQAFAASTGRRARPARRPGARRDRDPAAVAALVAALGAPPVPEEAKLGLLHAGRAAVEALAGEVAHGTPSSAVLAAALLGEIGDRRATATLSEGDRIARERRRRACRVAIEALERLQDPAAVPALARAAEAPQADVRLQAFAALQALADPRSVAVLDGGLADRDPRVRASAARLAGLLAARGAAATLADRLGDVDSAVRSAAARALARTGGAPLRRILAALARPRRRRRRRRARARLGRAGGDR